MLQYLINTTAIWLMSLLIFDIFLRKENYHGYNRIYLTGTLLLGIFLPLLSWKTKIITTTFTPHLYNSNVPVTFASPINTVGSRTITASSPSPLSWITIIIGLYALGVLFKLSQLAAELLKLRNYYNKGNKHQHGGWTIIETGKTHGPFSFLNCLYVSNVTQYDAQQFEIIVQHETEHRRLRHFADLLLIEFSSIIFWFHPLVHLYNKRLLMVHEYQADKIVGNDITYYQQLLVETSLLYSGGLLTHSFNRSPIKGRIYMLSRRFEKGNRLKLLFALPLFVCSLLFFTECKKVVKPNTSASKDWAAAFMDTSFIHHTHMVTFKGNVFEIPYPVRKPMPPILRVLKQQTERTTGKHVDVNIDTMKVTSSYPPVKMNGERIYCYVSGVAPQFPTEDGSLNKYIFRNCLKEMGALNDGEYMISISDVIVDKSGKIVYYSTPVLSDEGPQPAGVQAAIVAKTMDLLDHAPLCKPATKDGKYVLATLPDRFDCDVKVKNHIASLYKLPTLKLDTLKF